MTLTSATRDIKHLGLAAIMVCLLSGCASNTSTTQTFDMTALVGKSANKQSSKKTHSSLSVVEPTTLQALDTDRIAVREKDGGLSYLSGAMWADRLPKVLQVQMVRYLENQGFVASIGKQTDRFVANKALLVDLRHFEIDVSAGSVVHIAFSAKLVDDRTGKILKGKVFQIAQDVGAKGLYSDETFADPMAQLMDELLLWLQ